MKCLNLRVATATVSALFTVCSGPAQQQPADLVVVNAKVITLDDQRPQATAFAVHGGKFVAVGGEADVAALRRESTKVIEAKGHTVIPGLNDSHSHVVREGRLFNSELRWDGVDSLERGLSMVREQAARTPKGQWVSVIGGWSPYQFKEKRLPTVKELNDAAPDTPVFCVVPLQPGSAQSSWSRSNETDTRNEGS
jgi:predicted amidohydrolase YtcJ